MREEYEALIEKRTWNLVHKKDNMNIIGTKWVLKIKIKPNGKIKRYKTRLVAQDFNQHENVDYGLIYSPVVKSSTIRIVLSLEIIFLHKFMSRMLFFQRELKEIFFIALNL